MEVLEKNKTKIATTASIGAIAIIIFIILVKADPSAFKYIPVLGNVVYGQTQITSGNTTNDSSDQTISNSFSVGEEKGKDSIVPVTGVQLAPKGAYNDGTYPGFTSTPSGVLILKVTITKGAMTDISFLTIPKDYSENVLNSLASDAIKNQVVEISPMVGYDETSTTFTDALSNAIQKAFKVYNKPQ